MIYFAAYRFGFRFEFRVISLVKAIFASSILKVADLGLFKAKCKLNEFIRTQFERKSKTAYLQTEKFKIEMVGGLLVQV